MERRALQWSGRETSYLARVGDGIPLVFVHGATCAASGWTEVIERFPDRHCYAPDLPGHGASSPADRYGFDDDATALVEFLDSIVGPAVMIGHSRGGEAAWRAAFQRPDLVLGLVLEDVTPFFLETGNATSFPIIHTGFKLPPLVRRLRADGLPLEWLIAEMAQLPYDPQRTLGQALPEPTLRNWAEQASQLDPGKRGATSDFGPSSTPAADQLARLNVPLHIVYGDVTAGSIVTDDEIHRLGSSPAQVSSSRLAGVGHLVHAQAPETFIEDLQRYLARNGR